MFLQLCRRSGVLLLICSGLCSTRIGICDEPTQLQIPMLDDQLRKLVQDRDWEAADTAIEKALQQPDVSEDRLLYLKGRVLYLQGQYDAAVSVLGEVPTRFPQSPWARRARFAAGVALAKKGDFRAAALVYQTEAQTLLSDERKQEFASIYLEYADAYFEPAEEVKPDYAKALLFYAKALDAGPAADRRLDGPTRKRCHYRYLPTTPN